MHDTDDNLNAGFITIWIGCLNESTLRDIRVDILNMVEYCDRKIAEDGETEHYWRECCKTYTKKLTVLNQRIAKMCYSHREFWTG